MFVYSIDVYLFITPSSSCILLMIKQKDFERILKSLI